MFPHEQAAQRRPRASELTLARGWRVRLSAVGSFDFGPLTLPGVVAKPAESGRVSSPPRCPGSFRCCPAASICCFPSSTLRMLGCTLVSSSQRLPAAGTQGAVRPPTVRVWWPGRALGVPDALRLGGSWGGLRLRPPRTPLRQARPRSPLRCGGREHRATCACPSVPRTRLPGPRRPGWALVPGSAARCHLLPALPPCVLQVPPAPRPAAQPDLASGSAAWRQADRGRLGLQCSPSLRPRPWAWPAGPCCGFGRAMSSGTAHSGPSARPGSPHFQGQGPPLFAVALPARKSLVLVS